MKSYSIISKKGGRILFHKPVDIPQLRTQTFSSGAEELILATLPTWQTVYSLKVEVPRKWLMGFPLAVNLVLPSLSMTFLSVFIRRRSHMLLSSDLQCRHSLHSPVNTGRTVSPSFRSVTPSPTLSTTLKNHNDQTHFSFLDFFFIKIKEPDLLQNLDTYPAASWPKIRGNIGSWP